MVMVHAGKLNRAFSAGLQSLISFVGAFFLLRLHWLGCLKQSETP